MKCLFGMILVLTYFGVLYAQDIESLKSSIKARETLVKHCVAECTYVVEEPNWKTTESGTVSIWIDGLDHKVVVQPSKPSPQPMTVMPVKAVTEVEIGEIGIWYDYYPDSRIVRFQENADLIGMFGFDLPQALTQKHWGKSTISIWEDAKESHAVSEGDNRLLHLVDKEGAIQDFVFDSSKQFLLTSHTYANLGYEFKIEATNPIMIDGVTFGKNWDLTLREQSKILRHLHLQLVKLSLSDKFDKIEAPLVHGCNFRDAIDGSESTLK